MTVVELRRQVEHHLKKDKQTFVLWTIVIVWNCYTAVAGNHLLFRILAVGFVGYFSFQLGRLWVIRQDLKDGLMELKQAESRYMSAFN